MLLKKDIIDRLAERGHKKCESDVFIDDIVMVIAEALVRGESVMLRGFGIFEVHDMPARESMNLTTGKRTVIPRYKLPKFVPGETLKRFVKAGKMF